MWNGPLGAFEYSPFDKSTISVANIIQNYSSKSQLDALAGGGDTLAAIKKAKAKNEVSISKLAEKNAKQALSISDRGYVLVTGQNKFEGSGNELLQDPEVRRSFLGG